MNLSGKSFVISTHVYATGPAQDLKKYLLENSASKLLFIGHPLFHDKRLKGSGYEMFDKERKIEEYYTKLPDRKTNLCYYLLHMLRSIWWVYKTGIKYDLYVGSDNVNAIAGVFLKKLGRVSKSVYYVIDYNPHRFKNKAMNYIYHWVDRFCVKNSDETWNLSARMGQARKDYFGFSGGNQKVVPIGVWLDRIKLPKPEEIEKHTAVFMGHVTKKQGVQYVLKAIPEIVKSVPDFKFIVVGDGEYLEELKKITKELGVDKYVKFMGYIEDPVEMENMLSRCSLAVALYEKYDEDGNLTFTYFADPGKIKLYLACGLRVLTTEIIKTNDCYIYNPYVIGSDSYSHAELLAHHLKILNVEDRLSVVKSVSMYNWPIIFNNILNTI